MKAKRTWREIRMPRAELNVRNLKHGGYIVDLLTDEEKDQFENDYRKYLDYYTYLKEPVMQDMLREYLLIKIRLARLESYVFNLNIEEKEKFGADKLVNDLRRTMSLLATRMGISYVSRQRRKDKIKRELPFEIKEEE